MHGLSRRTDGLQPSSEMCTQLEQSLPPGQSTTHDIAPAWWCVGFRPLLADIAVYHLLGTPVYLSPLFLLLCSAPSCRAVCSHPNSFDSLIITQGRRSPSSTAGRSEYATLSNLHVPDLQIASGPLMLCER